MSLVKLSKEGAVALVTLDRPPVNALSAELSADLLAAFTECQQPEVRAVVVTGEPHFAAGADITGFKAAFDAGQVDGELFLAMDFVEGRDLRAVWNRELPIAVLLSNTILVDRGQQLTLKVAFRDAPLAKFDLVLEYSDALDERRRAHIAVSEMTATIRSQG